jgi:LEA14-like dessication related protein
LHSLKLDNLTFTGAKLNLKVKVDNPNIWSVMLNKLDYSLNINGKQWIQGITDRPLNINGKQNNIITIPIALNFLQIGSSVYSIISGGKGLDYSLKGSADLGSSLELLRNFNLPFSKAGKVDLLK